MLHEPPKNFDFHAFLQGVYWHQGWEVFPGTGMRTPGRSPVEVALDLTGVPSDLAGARVLDIGAWNGCTSFECERRGASEVISLSLESPDSGFNQLKALLKSTNCSFVNGTIYNLDPRELGKFDIVLCFGVIYHLRYPTLGIDNLRRIARGSLHLETHLLDNCFRHANNEIGTLADDDASLLQFYAGSELYGDASNWFSPSMSALGGMLSSAGFVVEKSTKNADRGYVNAKILPGRPPFLTGTYEGNVYEACGLGRLLGPEELWDK